MTGFSDVLFWCRRSTQWLLLGGLLAGVLSGCSEDRDRRFARLEAERTGVDFVNRIPTDDSLMNPLDFFYVYNGGGVGVGDLNNDGLPDLYFAGNVVGNRLYLNRGELQFRDVTGEAGVEADSAWATGVAIVDVNQDGWQDIYVSVGGPAEVVGDRANRLYVNQGVGADGVPTFEERAAAYGIASTRYSTQSAFFDYDRDGDLDLYVLNTANVRKRRRSQQGGDPSQSNSNLDQLYRNDTGSESSTGAGTFTEVSEEAGIGGGFGLGLAVSDVNGDDLPDVYAANDLYTSDRLYVNQGDGTFADRSGRFLKHQSYSAMGVDIADVNNDARSDILVLDMLPQSPRRRRLVSIKGTPADGHWQYVRNTLQLNRGAPAEHTIFSEVGQQAGIEATGWSWAPLLADYDNDGDRDLFVTNGFGELITHLDFGRLRDQMRASSLSGDLSDEAHDRLIQALDELPTVHLPNRFFENTGSPQAGAMPQFTERTGTWAPSRPGISNGAAFADLDRDGDLDLVTNNVNAPATLLKNRTAERRGAHAVRVDLRGPEGNRSGLGTTLTLYDDGTSQYHDHSPYRGYQSTVEGIAHFGLGADSTADSLRVEWPDGRTQLLTDVPTDSVLTVQYEASSSSPQDVAPSRPISQDSALFRDVTAARGLQHRHRETTGSRPPPLQPHQLSANGPGLAVGDVDGNGLDDVFVGADRGRERVLFRQIAPGRFRKQTLAMKHSYSGTRSYEDMGALFFDAEGDGDLDLYVVSGSTVGRPGTRGTTYQDRLYLNDGTGAFQRAPDALPDITASGSVVTAADYDRDGDLDLFVGGRVSPGEYPLPPRSYLLRNDSEEGRVQFTDVTEKIAPELAEVGLVTDALWTDYDDDGRVDLLVAGEWMPLSLFENETGGFVNRTDDVGLGGTSGWWNSLAAGDFDRDGDTDYVAGNLGRNTRYEASPQEPARIHAKDFNRDGRVEPILSQYVQGTSYPVHGRRALIDQLPRMRERFPSYRAYAGTPLSEVLPPEAREGAYVGEANRFATSYLENREDSTFAIRALPPFTQIAPVFGIQTGDFDGDGSLDLLMVGNWYAPNPETGRADAFTGAFLQGNGTGHFTHVSSAESGFFVDGDAKALASVTAGEERLLLSTQNDDSLKAFRSTQPEARPVALRPLDRSAELHFADGAIRKTEFHHGSTYLSQSSRTLWIPPSVTEVVIHGVNGTRTLERPFSTSATAEGTTEL